MAVVVAALALLGPGLALAHTRLERSHPAAGAHLVQAPTELRLVFSATVERAFTRLRLLGPDGAEVSLGDARLDSARIVTAAIRGALTAGTYTVTWQVAGADGHPIRGRYTFMIAPGAAGLAGDLSGAGARGEPAGAVAAPGQAPATSAHHDPTTFPERRGFDAGSPLYVAVRWLTFSALLIVIGAVAFRSVVLALLARRDAAGSRRSFVERVSAPAAALGLGAAAVLGVAALARLAAQSYAMYGAGEATDASLVAMLLSRTVWGWGWLAQLVGVLVALTGFALARGAKGPRRAGWALAAVGAAVLAFTPALSGHAVSAPRLTALTVLADGLHVVGAGGWLGSLLFVIAVGVPVALRLGQAERGPAVADLVNAFSPTALLFAGVAATTGLFAAWVHLGSVSALWATPYGRTLLVKLAILLVVAGTGAYNWRRVRPALGDITGARRIRRSAAVELTVGVLVLVVTAILVATPTPMDALAMTAR